MRVGQAIAQADMHFQVQQVVGDPRGPDSTLYWARGFRQPLDGHSFRVFEEGKQRWRGAAPLGAQCVQPQPTSGAAGSPSGE